MSSERQFQHPNAALAKSSASTASAGAQQSGMVTLMVRLHAKAERAVELEAVLRNLVAEARKEAGCVDYHMHRRADDPNTFGFYENWRSRKDFEEHLRTPCQVDFGNARAQYLVGDVELEFYEMLSPYDK